MPSRTIPELLTYWADCTPAAPAILAPGRPPVTYLGLKGTIESIGREMVGLAAGAGSRVAIVLPNGPEMAIAFLGVSACATAAPLNPAYGTREFEFYLSDLGAKALIVQAGSDSAAIPVARAAGIPVLRLTLSEDGTADLSALSGSTTRAMPGPPRTRPDDAALVLHTSGTTSRPKMVPLSHSNLCLSAQNIAQWFALNASDRCLNVMPLFHIHGLVGAVLSSLSAGAAIVCTPGFDATKFFGWMSRFDPTWYTAVPTMHQAILARAGQHGEVIGKHRLRFIRSCSSALAPTLLESLEKTFTVPVLEAYGMTEASHQIAANPLPPGVRRAGSVGLAAGPEVAIMDGEGRLMEPGATGEIVLRGPTITAGYEANPEANLNSFSDGWFRTGDQGFVDGDGFIFISARIKEIINRGGEKISPREIEEVLLQHPAVSQAVAFSIPHAQLGEEVGCAVVLKAAAALEEAGLRQFAAERLAYFKVPRLVRILPEIPKGATGKVQRIGMAERLQIERIDDRAAPAAAFRSAHTPMQQRILRIFQEVLAVKDIGIDEPFFRAGGDSILATALIVGITKETGVPMSLVELMDAPTVAGVAERIEAGKLKAVCADGSSLLVPVQPKGELSPLFCAPGLYGSVLQFWSLSRHLGPDQPVFAFADGTTRAASIEEEAAKCARLMRAHQPSGPYMLLGNCFGGFVVYEMARQLTAAGERVPLLIMLDCFNHAWRRTLPVPALLAQSARHALARSRFHVAKFAELGARGSLPYVAGRFAAFRQGMRDRVLQRVHDFNVRRKRPVPKIADKVNYAHRWAEQSYERKPYAGDVALFRSTDPAAAIYPAPQMGWSGLIEGTVEVYDIPGDHLRMLFEPAVSSLAHVLRDRLRAFSRPRVSRMNA